MIIAIDGPSGAGKSTLARLLSRELGFDYIDTGAMYRALAYKAYKDKVGMKESEIAQMLEITNITYYDNQIFLDGVNVEKEIRDEVISKLSSQISAFKIVREKMVELQRKIAENKNVILDGRDIGTVVFPHADYKFFVTASANERANRRHRQLIANQVEADYHKILQDIIKRDEDDSTREHSPLKMAEDAILIDTSNMDIDTAVKAIAQYIGGQNVL